MLFWMDVGILLHVTTACTIASQPTGTPTPTCKGVRTLRASACNRILLLKQHENIRTTYIPYVSTDIIYYSMLASSIMATSGGMDNVATVVYKLHVLADKNNKICSNTLETTFTRRVIHVHSQ